MLTRWPAFSRFLEDGRICLTNNAAERALRGLATGLSLCTSFSSVWKHWKRPRRLGATRAPFPSDGRGDGLRMQVA
jgi:transposase